MLAFCNTCSDFHMEKTDKWHKSTDSCAMNPGLILKTLVRFPSSKKSQSYDKFFIWNNQQPHICRFFVTDSPTSSINSLKRKNFHVQKVVVFFCFFFV